MVKIVKKVFQEEEVRQKIPKFVEVLSNEGEWIATSGRARDFDYIAMYAENVWIAWNKNWEIPLVYKSKGWENGN